MKYKETKSLKKQFLVQHVRDNFVLGSVYMEVTETEFDMYCKVIDNTGDSIILKINRNWDVQETSSVKGKIINQERHY